jgi:hypothetical protein
MTNVVIAYVVSVSATTLKVRPKEIELTLGTTNIVNEISLPRQGYALSMFSGFPVFVRVPSDSLGSLGLSR